MSDTLKLKISADLGELLMLIDACDTYVFCGKLNHVRAQLQTQYETHKRVSTVKEGM